MPNEKDDFFDEMFTLSSDYIEARKEPNKKEIKEDIELTKELDMPHQAADISPNKGEKEKPTPPQRKKQKVMSGLRSLFERDEAVPIEITPKEKAVEDTNEYATSILDENIDIKKDKFYLISEDTKTEIDKPVFTVGIRENSDLILPEDKVVHMVSRHHASFYLKNDTCYVKDFSSNGTFIGDNKDNMSRLPKDIEVEIRDGQVIKFADKVFTFRKE